jgi:small subunit ribosomal protein S35
LSREEQDDAFLDGLAQQPGVTYTTTEEQEDVSKIDESNMSALAHRELQQHRELREMVRLAAWEMPLLSQYTTPFRPPREDQILKWRYTTYLGETHPAARKVVVEFEPARIPDLSPEQLSKLLKIAGPRYNPSTKIIKMSTDSFETQAQNKRYLAETIDNLIAECKDPNADSFADVPLDTRHHRPKPQYKFPEAWIMTPERRVELEAKRKASMLEEAKQIEEDRLVHGLRAIEEARKVDAAKVEEPLMANARQSLLSGKMGKREMGQKPNARR